MKLTNIKCKNLKSKDKTYRVFDGKGLFLQIMSNGAKYWRYRYHYFKKERTLALEVYPETSLEIARVAEQAISENSFYNTR